MSSPAVQLLVCLVAAHVLNDFLFQSNHVASNKSRFSILLIHSASVAFLSYLSCGVWRSWMIPAAVFGTHGLIDGIKSRLETTVTSFALDQVAHLVSLVAIATVAAPRSPTPFGVMLFGEAYLRALVLGSGAVLTVFGCAVLVGLAMKPLRNELSSAHGEEARGFSNGGRLIGQLERSLILLFVLSGQPAGIGFLIAAKSVFRFGELKEQRNRLEAEYIIIGTLMSFGSGMVVAYVTRELLSYGFVAP